jgi:hypothetical protein
MKAKIITKEEAVRLGLTREGPKRRGGGGPRFLTAVVVKKGVSGSSDEVVEQFRINRETGKKEILHEKKEYKDLKKKLKINEFRPKGIAATPGPEITK